MPDLYFECHSGISGDMTLGALVALGADLEAIRQHLATLPIAGFRLRLEAVKQHGIAGARVIVEIDEDHDHHRHWSDVREIIENGRLPERAKTRALAAYERLARAEAKVHGVDVHHIHFHEVGALDAIIDVAGSMVALDLLGAERVGCSAINVGHGTIRCGHGEYPVPAPATAELLRGVPCYQDELGGELVTPTGAAIITTVAESFGPMPAFAADRVGYGSGTREHAHRPNYLRVSLGRFIDAAGALMPRGLDHERLRLLTAEIDDQPGELFTALFERLFEAGARDVNLVPIQMKKNRPGVSLQVLATASAAPGLAEIILRESSSFGVKMTEADRYCLPRRFEDIETRYGPVRVKIAEWNGKFVKAKPEFDCCARLARARGVSAREVLLHVQERIAVRFGAGEESAP